MTTYSLHFRNDASSPWTACVFQPSLAPRQEAVAWLTATAVPGAEAQLKWTTALSVVLGTRVANGAHAMYVAVEQVEADAGTRWSIVDRKGEQRLRLDDDGARPDQIIIRNESGRAASPGVALSGTPLSFVRDLAGGAAAQFLVRAPFFVALFRDMRSGEVLPRPPACTLPLKVDGGLTDATLHVSEEGSKLVIDLRPGGIVRLPMQQVGE